MYYTAEASRPPMPTSQTVVVGTQYCSPYELNFVITKKLLTLKEGSFTVIDTNGNTFFKIKGTIFSIRDRRILLDASDTPILTFQQKILSAHRRWLVYRGDSTDDKDLLFSTKKSSLIQLRTELDVCLAANHAKDKHFDFKVKGSWFKKSCQIFSADGSTLIAQMKKQLSVASFVLDKDTFGVTVVPNVDYAFIVAVVAILYEINQDKSGED